MPYASAGFLAFQFQTYSDIGYYLLPRGSAARYEDRVGDNHHHLICRVFGTTADIDCVVGAAPCLTANDDYGLQIDEAEVIYWAAAHFAAR